MDQFYLTLPSNSSKEFYGQQKLNHFKTKLSQPLHLDVNEYECGLAEIIYPHSWKNLKEESQVCVGISDLTVDPESGKYRILEKNFTVQQSHYINVADLVKKINKRMKIIFQKFMSEYASDHDTTNQMYYGIHEKYLKASFRFDENVGKVYLSGNNHLYVILPPALAQMMGFGDTAALIGSEVLCPQISRQLCHHSQISCHVFRYADEVETDPHIKLLKGDYVADVHRGLTSLYIYSPIIQSQLVGDTLAPLLRVVNVRGSFGEQVNERYDNIYYLPLISSPIEHIEIYIRDDVGNLIPFESGRVVIVLHFRRRK